MTHNEWADYLTEAIPPRPGGYPKGTYARKVREAIRRAGHTPVPAKFDAAGNCLTCGEAGRCPKYHAAPRLPED